MANPWTKKNPFLSMWLSGANALAGKARIAGKAEAGRQQTGGQAGHPLLDRCLVGRPQAQAPALKPSHDAPQPPQAAVREASAVGDGAEVKGIHLAAFGPEPVTIGSGCSRVC